MKTFQFASILVLAATVTFACSDDDDDVTPGTAGSSGSSTGGKNGTAGSNSAAGKNGTAGSSTGGTSTAGTGGSTAGTAGSATNAGAGGAAEGGFGGVGGASEGGVGGVGGEGGSAGENALGGAGGEGGAPVEPDVIVNGPVELIGTWKDPEWGGLEVITQTTWNGANIVGYDSGAKAVYTHNTASSFNPGKYSKTVFTQPAGDAFYYCQIVYKADSLEAAKADTGVADPTKLEDKGCAGAFNWTKVLKQP